MKIPNFIEKILETSGFIRKEKAAMPGVLSGGGTDPLMIWQANRKGVSADKALQAYNGWVYAAIRAIAMEIGGIELRLFKTGRETDKEIFEHEVLDLIGAVNDYQTSFELFYTIAAHLETTGNAYLYLEGAKNENGKPDAIHTMNPGKVKLLVNRNQFPTRIEGYEYQVGTKKYSFNPYEVLHIKYPDPNDPLEGIGTVQSIGQWVDADNSAMEFNRQFFKNGARINGFLESDAARTPEQLEYLKASFEAAHAGLQNAYTSIALPQGTTYKEGGQTQKDLDFANLMTMMRDRIIAGLRVPRTALGITDDVNRANAEATDYVFAARTIKPIMKIITTYLNEFLIPRFGTDLYLDFKDPVPEDRIAKTEEHTKAAGGSAWKTINEIREEEGLDPVEGGDSVQIPFSVMPLGEVERPEPEPEEDKEGMKGKRRGKSSARRTRFASNQQKRQDLAGELAKRASEGVAKIFAEAMKAKRQARKNIGELTDDQYEAIYKAFAVRIDPYEKKMAKAVQELNAKQRKEVLGNLPKVAKAIKKGDLFDAPQSIALLINLLEPIVQTLASKEGKEAAALLGIQDLDIMTPEVRRALEKSTRLLSQSYNDTTADLLKGKLEKGLKEGLAQDELADIVNTVFDYSDEARALSIAKTETFRIANYANREAWTQSGVVKNLVWFTAADERTCPYCSPMHGKTVGTEEQWFKKGDTVEGSDGSKLEVDYADIDAPPLHPNCRCYIRPGTISLT